MFRKLALTLLALTVLVSTGTSQIIAGWDFDPIPSGPTFGGTPYAATTTAANVTVTSGGLVRNWALTTGTGAANAWGGNNFDITATDFTTALAANNFASFTLQADPGYQLSLSSIDAYNIRRSATGPTTGRWQYQVGAAPFVDLTPDIIWGNVTTAAGNPQLLIDLSTITALQNVTAPITFRVVTWGATTTGGTWYLNDPVGAPGDDFTISGSVTLIPEPGTYALLTIALVTIVLVRRRLLAKNSVA